MVVDTKTYLDDQSSLRALVGMMPDEERAIYMGYKSLTLEAAFPGRKMVIFTLRGGKATDVEMISFGDLCVDWDTGPNATVEDSRGKTQILAVPKRIRPRELFLHIPQSFNLRYKGRRDSPGGVKFMSHYAILVKTRSKVTLQIEGDTYCVTLNDFRERYPDLRLRY